MGHAMGIIFSKEENPKILGYYEYDGTADICIPVIRDSIEELNAHWRQIEWSNCKKSLLCEDIPVYIYSDYGAGYYWEGTICLHCKTITAGLEPDYDTEETGRPDKLPTSYYEIMKETE